MKTDYVFPVQVTEKGAELGYVPGNLPLLFLVPFVQVAWGKGSCRRASRKRLCSLPEICASITNIRITDASSAGSTSDRAKNFSTAQSKICASCSKLFPRNKPPVCARCCNSAASRCRTPRATVGLLRGGSNIRRDEREQLHHIGERPGLTQSLA